MTISSHASKLETRQSQPTQFAGDNATTEDQVFYFQISLALGQGPLQKFLVSIQGGLVLLNCRIPALSLTHTHTLSLYPSMWLEKDLLLSRSSSAAIQAFEAKLPATTRRIAVAKYSFSRQPRRVQSFGANLAPILLRLPAQVPLATSGHNRTFLSSIM